MKIRQNRKRGTDEAFLQLMKVSGNSVLKLLGMSKESANKYHFRAVVLKDKKLEPDVEGIPTLESKEGRVFLEFQGYSDEFIRYRLMAQVFWGCIQASHSGKVVAGIVYTDEKYKSVALPLNLFKDIKNCRLSEDCFREIVLTDYTEKELWTIDPKLIVLAPFTLSDTAEKSTQLAKGREWCEEVTRVFPASELPEALNVLGLFVLNRFRSLRYEEVRAMLNFDMMDTVAGQQIYEKGHWDGLLEEARDMVTEALKERFEIVPSEMSALIFAIKQPPVLRNLFRQAMRCQDLESFKEILSKVIGK